MLIDGVTIAAIGVVAGGLVGWGLSRLAGNYVPELKLPGPLLLIASAAVIFAAAAIASLVPAARAARVDAVQAFAQNEAAVQLETNNLDHKTNRKIQIPHP